MDSEDGYIRCGGDVERSLGLRVFVELSSHGCEDGDVEDDAGRGEWVGRCKRVVCYVDDAASEGEVGYEDVGFEADTCADAVGNQPINDMLPQDRKKANDSLPSRCSCSPNARLFLFPKQIDHLATSKNIHLLKARLISKHLNPLAPSHILVCRIIEPRLKKLRPIESGTRPHPINLQVLKQITVQHSIIHTRRLKLSCYPRRQGGLKELLEGDIKAGEDCDRIRGSCGKLVGRVVVGK